MTAKAPQEIPEGAVRPKAPSAPPGRNLYGEDHKELPLLPSERASLQQKVKDANQKYELSYDAALRKFTSVINLHEGLTTEQKESILYRIWKE